MKAHLLETCWAAAIAALWSLQAPCEGLVLYQSGVGEHGAVLENSDQVHTVTDTQGGHVDIVAGKDPYAKVEWRFRFKIAPPSDWRSLFIEIEYLDENAGVIQPRLLQSDAHRGAWDRPLRAVSFTMLNTGRVRRALF